jgi:hypothetical protein
MQAGILNAQSFTIRADGRVLSSGSQLNWATRTGAYYIVAANDATSARYTFQYVSCSVVQSDSAAVTSVTGATGALACVRSDGVAVKFYNCSNGGVSLVQSANSQSFSGFSQCQPLDLAAIPVGTTAC